jgi:rubrerythrin
VADAVVVEEEEEKGVAWTCEVCTFINEDPLMHMCEMCGVLKA